MATLFALIGNVCSNTMTVVDEGTKTIVDTAKAVRKTSKAANRAADGLISIADSFAYKAEKDASIAKKVYDSDEYAEHKEKEILKSLGIKTKDKKEKKEDKSFTPATTENREQALS
jgi:hypothetical protein